MMEIFAFIRNNTGLSILTVSLLTLIISLTKLLPKRPMLKITGYYSKWTDLIAPDIHGNDDTSDKKRREETNASREMLTKISLSLRNISKKRAFRIRIKKLHEGIRVKKNLSEECSIEPDDEITIELEYAKRVYGKYNNLKRPEFFKDIDITKDFGKKESIVDISYENSKGKEFTISYRIKKSENKTVYP